MTKSEFETIIKPLSVLVKDNKEFLISALLGDFYTWKENKEVQEQEAENDTRLKEIEEELKSLDNNYKQI